MVAIVALYYGDLLERKRMGWLLELTTATALTSSSLIMRIIMRSNEIQNLPIAGGVVVALPDYDSILREVEEGHY